MTRTRRFTGAAVQQHILTYCRALGIDIERQNTGVGHYQNADGSVRTVRYGCPGDLDLRGTLPDGRRLEIEAKATGQKPTLAQLARCERINRHNGVAFWADDVDIVRLVLPHILAGARIERVEDRDGPMVVVCREDCRACHT